MAWPRIKNSRSSAQPGTQPHDGVQATVTPAPDAEPVPGSTQNAGVTGTRHTIAWGQGADARSPRHDRTGKPRLGPIRYAHSGVDDTPLGPPPAGAAPADRDGTAGLLYEAPRPAYAEPQGPSGLAPSFEPTTPDDGPRDDGISIFGDMATTEVPAEDEPTMDFRFPRRSPEQGPDTIPDFEPIRSAPGPAAVGGTWNLPTAPPPQAVGPAVQSKPRAFNMRIPSWRTPAPAGDGQPRISVRDLPPDVQIRFWRLRITIMLVVGLAVGLLTMTWEIGLTVAILAGIADYLYRSRRAPDYANGASQRGAHRRIRRQLNRMRRRGYFALDARPIPNSREIIDHLVVGPTGVYAIDSEKWDRSLPIRTWNGKRLYHGPASQKPRLEHAVWEAQQASEVLSAALGTEIVVRPALAIFGPKIPWDIATIRDVDVFSGPALGKYLKRRGRMRDGVPRLTREEARTIYDTAARMLPDVAPTRTATPVG